MRKRALLLTGLAATLVAGFAIAPSAHAGVILRSPPALGLVGYWSMNEGTSTTVHDFSGNNNHGSTSPPYAATWTNGKRGKALNFDGVDDYIQVPDSALLSSSNIKTISMWIKPDSLTGFLPRIINQYTDANNYWAITIPGSGAGTPGAVALSVKVGGVQVDLETAGGTISQVGVWYHILAQFNGSTIDSIFINGEAQPLLGPSTVYTFGTNVLLAIGNRNDAIRPFPGAVDDVRLYNRMLGTSSAQVLFKSGAVTRKTPSNRGLVGYWSMDEGTSTVVHDFSGNKNHGTTSDATAATWTNGKRGKALSFDGAGIGDYVSVPDSDSLDLTNAVSFGAWIKVPNYGQFYYIARKGPSGTAGDDNSGNYSFEVNQTSGFLRFVHQVDAEGTQAAYGGNRAITMNEWTHVVISFEASGDVVFYINGSEAGSSAANPSFGLTNDEPLRIGTRKDNLHDFNGLIDEVRIYNRALSADEVKALYQTKAAVLNSSQNTRVTDGLVGMWSFNGQDMGTTSARDSSGNNNTGWLSGGTQKVSGKVGQALEFNGTTSLVLTGNLSLSNTFTVTAWVNPALGPDNDNFPRIVETSFQDGFFLGVDATETNYQWIVNNSVPPYGSVIGGTIIPGQWDLVAGTYDGTTGILYENGLSVSSNTFTAPGPTAFPVFIGRFFSADQVSSRWKGKVDEVRIYNRALGPDEIKQLYNMGR